MVIKWLMVFKMVLMVFVFMVFSVLIFVYKYIKFWVLFLILNDNKLLFKLWICGCVL